MYMYIHIYRYICVHIYICIYILYVYVYIYTYVYIYVYIYVCMYICVRMYVYMYIYMYIYMYVCLCVCVCICVCVFVCACVCACVCVCFRFPASFLVSLTLRNTHEFDTLFYSHFREVTPFSGKRVIVLVCWEFCCEATRKVHSKNRSNERIAKNIPFWILRAHYPISPKSGPLRGVFWMSQNAFSRQKRIFLKTKKADQKHCENWRREIGSEFHKTSPTCERGEWRRQLQESLKVSRLFWPNGIPPDPINHLCSLTGK